MKTLDEHNHERWARHKAGERWDYPHANGIECPMCQKELWDSDPMVTLTVSPPQKSVNCPACGYSGYRFA